MNNIVKIIRILSKQQKLSYLARERKTSEKSFRPYRVLISTVLSQRNRDEMTEIASNNLFSEYKTVKEIADADVKNLEKLIKKSGFYRTKAKRIKEISKILLEKYKGKVPDSTEELLKLPGVGRKTAGCVLVYGFRKKAIPVDTHVHRISNRLGLVKTKTPEKTEIELMRIVPENLWIMVNEVFVNHGQSICKPINPKCSVCPILKYCNYGLKKIKND